MKCEKYLDAIDDLVEGELDEQSAERINLHVFACSQCASRYEMLKREKQMFARYLFDVEPSNNLWMKFQEKLESETNGVSQIAVIPAGVSTWKAFTNRFLRLPPAFAGAVLLVLFGIGFAFLRFAPDEKIAKNEYTARTEFSAVQSTKVESAETDRNETITSPLKPESGDKNIASPKSIKNKHENKSSHTKNIAAINARTVAVKATKTKERIISASEQKDLPDFARLTEDEQMQMLQLKTLEKETVKQIEKIEMLLRSFRNSRSVESGEAFDVAYEKQQARKLLEKNVQLRRGAEDLGILYTEEILSKVEPHLLDIANLENNPAPEKVLGIKERVKNQNIIASLQVY